MHQTVDASLNSSNPVGIAVLVGASGLSRGPPEVKTKFLHAMGMTFTTITDGAEVKVIALSAVIPGLHALAARVASVDEFVIALSV